MWVVVFVREGSSRLYLRKLRQTTIIMSQLNHVGCGFRQKREQQTVPEEAPADHCQSVSAEPCGLWLPWSPQLSWCGVCRRMPGLRRPPHTGPARAAGSEALPCLSD